MPGGSVRSQPEASAPALAARGLMRSFGPVRALAGVDFGLGAGDVLAVFGPNGAGKTTLLRVLAGLLRPDRGEVVLGGEPLRRGDPRHRGRVGLISHQSLLYDGLTAAENLRFFGRLYGLRDASGAAGAALEAVGLADQATSRVGTMSRGMVQRLAIARALLHQPEVVLLDEPFTGLDQRAAASLRAQLGRLGERGRTVVLVTHHLDEGLELASHVAIMAAGRFVECAPKRGDLSNYRARYAEAVQDA